MVSLEFARIQLFDAIFCTATKSVMKGPGETVLSMETAMEKIYQVEV